MEQYKPRKFFVVGRKDGFPMWHRMFCSRTQAEAFIDWFGSKHEHYEKTVWQNEVDRYIDGIKVEIEESF